jgi:hypothetical protein
MPRPRSAAQSNGTGAGTGRAQELSPMVARTPSLFSVAQSVAALARSLAPPVAELFAYGLAYGGEPGGLGDEPHHRCGWSFVRHGINGDLS